MKSLHDQDSTLHRWYANREHCLEDIAIAREVFCRNDTTKEQFLQLEKMLHIMLVHCPKDIKAVIRTTILAADDRRKFFEEVWNASIS